MGFFKRKNHFDVDGRTVVITGGSTGMGRGLAKILASKGANVVIVARTQSKLDDALKELSACTTSSAKDKSTQRFHAISADVTKAAENDRIINEVTTWNNGQPPDIVWANAGASIPALFLDTSVETLKAQMDINYFAAAFLAQTTLKSWTQPSSKDTDQTSRSKPRHFIMTSSIACFIGLAGYAPYSPCKAALRNLADTLHSEVNLYNGARRKDPTSGPPNEIKIHCVFPGTIDSPGFETENKTKPQVTHVLEEGDTIQSGDEVAAASIKGLERGNFLVTTQITGEMLRVSSLGGSVRNGFWIVDTLFSWACSIAWFFVRPEMDGKVFKYGETHGMGRK